MKYPEVASLYYENIFHNIHTVPRELFILGDLVKAVKYHHYSVFHKLASSRLSQDKGRTHWDNLG